MCSTSHFIKLHSKKVLYKRTKDTVYEIVYMAQVGKEKKNNDEKVEHYRILCCNLYSQSASSPGAVMEETCLESKN